jgi:hypothetical protein
MTGATLGPRNTTFSELYVPLASGGRAHAKGGIIFARDVTAYPFEKTCPGRRRSEQRRLHAASVYHRQARLPEKWPVQLKPHFGCADCLAVGA